MMSIRRLPLTPGRTLRCLSVAAVSTILVCPAVVGQDRLGPAFPANPASWNADQRAEAELFVSVQLSKVLSGEESEISEGKTALVEALTFPGGTERYISQLSESIAGGMEPLMASPELMVRVNAIFVCTYLDHANALGPIETGLKDDNAGVRYHAANAMANLLAGERLTGNERTAALKVLVDTTVLEEDVYVVQPMLDALIRTEDDALVLQVLNDRVARHIGQPHKIFDGEVRALQTVYTRIITNPNPPSALVRELAKVSVRYMRLVAEQLAAGQVPADRERSHVNMINVAATALRAAHENLAAPGFPPANPNPANPAGVRGIANDWVEVLLKPPFGYTADDLSIEADEG